MKEKSENDSLQSKIYNSMQQKETEELIKIWQEHDQDAWSEMAFEAVQKILIERLGELPDSSLPISGSQLIEAKTEGPSPDAQNKLKAAYRALEKGESADDVLQVCDSLLQTEPFWADAHNLRGMALEDLNRPDEALVAYRQALRFKPSFSEAQRNLSDLENRMKTRQNLSDSSSHDPSISVHLEQAISYLKKRKFKWAMEECELVIKIAPQLSVAQELRKLIQDRKTLYTRGEFSIFFGIVLLYSMFSMISANQGELTTLGAIAMGLGIFLVVEGLVVALSGLTMGFLIDGITICVVGVWNVGTSVIAGEVNWLFIALGLFQLFWGVNGILEYRRKSKVSFQEIEQQIDEISANLEEKTSPEAMEKLNEAYRAYEKGKNRKKILQMCDDILQLDPNLAAAQNLRAMVLEDLKRPEEALAAYREALRLEPSFSDAKENLSDLENRMEKQRSMQA